MKQKVFTDKFISVFDILFGATFEEAIENLREEASKYEPNTQIHHIYGDIYGDTPYSDEEYFVKIARDETDAEYSDRLKREEAIQKKIEKQKATKEARERKQYENLKKKFG